MSSKAVRFEPLSLSAGLLALAGLIFVGCHPGSSPTAPDDPFSSSSTEVVSSAARQQKSAVCHVEGSGGYHPVAVAQPSVPAHLGHGDWLVVEETCDGLDNDCDGLIDEDDVCSAAGACPCYTAEELAATDWTSGFTVCSNDPLAGGVNIFSIGAGVNVAQNEAPPQNPDRVCAIEVEFGPTAGLSVFHSGLTQAEWLGCNELVVAEQERLGLDCR